MEETTSDVPRWFCALVANNREATLSSSMSLQERNAVIFLTEASALFLETTFTAHESQN
jgi:hypothetical protein